MSINRNPAVSKHLMRADGHREALGQGQGQVPEPLTQADGEGHISWGKASQDTTFKMYKMMMKSANGWQLDGHVSL